MSPHVSIDRDAVPAFCQRHHIKRLALFGSVLRDDFGPDSDIDVLVEFEAGHVPSLNFVSMEREFSGLLHGRHPGPTQPHTVPGEFPRQGSYGYSSAATVVAAAMKCAGGISDLSDGRITHYDVE